MQEVEVTGSNEVKEVNPLKQGLKLFHINIIIKKLMKRLKK